MNLNESTKQTTNGKETKMNTFTVISSNPIKATLTTKEFGTNKVKAEVWAKYLANLGYKVLLREAF